MLYWPVPGLSRILDILSLEAEQACDDEVLESGANAADYAQLLVGQARRETLPTTLALGRPSELSQRVSHILSDRIDHRVTRLSALWFFPACVLLTIPLATFNLVEVSAAGVESYTYSKPPRIIASPQDLSPSAATARPQRPEPPAPQPSARHITNDQPSSQTGEAREIPPPDS